MKIYCPVLLEISLENQCDNVYRISNMDVSNSFFKARCIHQLFYESLIQESIFPTFLICVFIGWFHFKGIVFTNKSCFKQVNGFDF